MNSSPFKTSSFCVSAMLIVFLVMSGCSTMGPMSGEPSWWENPQKHGPQYLYFKAKGESGDSLEAARRKALLSIQSQIARYVLSEVRLVESDAGSSLFVESAIELREVEIFGEDQGRSGRQWLVWMLGRYPREEYDRIRDRLEAGVMLEDKWRDAQSLINRQQDTFGEQLLLDIIHSYDKALRVSFELEAVKLELAALYLKQNRGLRARQWITDVQKTTALPTWRSRADVLAGQVPPVSLGDAFDGLLVGICCGTRKGGILSLDTDMAQALNIRLAKHGIQSILARESLLANIQVIDDQSTKRIAEVLRAQSADVVFLLVVEVDSSKTGTRINIPGSDGQADALDANLSYWIIRSTDGLLLASDSTLGFSHSLTAMLNTIMTHRRHLPSHAVKIAEAFDK